LLILDRFFSEIHQGGGVHVDVVESCLDGLPDQVFHRLDLLLGVLGVFPRVDLEMIPLEKHRPPITDLEGRGGDGGDIFLGTLPGVIDFRPGDLENHGTDVEFHGGPERRLGGVVGEGADIDGGYGKAFGLPASHGLVESLDRSREHTRRRAGPADQPPGRGAHRFVVAEDGGMDQIVHCPFPQSGPVVDLHLFTGDLEDAGHAFLHFPNLLVNHFSTSSKYFRAISTS